MFYMLSILIAYFLGAIPFGLLVPRLFGVPDVRKVGSGNIGATNAWRAAGPVAGILALIFDIAKGMGAVAIAINMPEAYLESEYLVLAAGLAAIIGHVFPIYLKFKGGKGVNTALGVMLMIVPLEAFIAIVIFVIVVSLSRYISLGSILAAIGLFLVIFIRWYYELAEIPGAYVIVSFLLAILIIFAHKSNIKRLFSGNENRFSFSSKSSDSVNGVKNVKEVNENG